jgi:hypothetical protein
MFEVHRNCLLFSGDLCNEVYNYYNAVIACILTFLFAGKGRAFEERSEYGNTYFLAHMSLFSGWDTHRNLEMDHKKDYLKKTARSRLWAFKFPLQDSRWEMTLHGE